MCAGWAYILQCSDGRYYCGSTNDLIQRLQKHRAGLVKSTKWRLPFRLVWFEEHSTLDRAKQREYSLKNGRSRRKKIDALIRGFPLKKLTPFVSVARQGLR